MAFGSALFESDTPASSSDNKFGIAKALESEVATLDWLFFRAACTFFSVPDSFSLAFGLALFESDIPASSSPDSRFGIAKPLEAEVVTLD